MNRFNLECLIEARMERFNYPLEMAAVEGIADFLEEFHQSPLDGNIDDLLVNAMVRYDDDEIERDWEDIKQNIEDGSYIEVYYLKKYNSEEHNFDGFRTRWFVNMEYFYNYIYKTYQYKEVA